MNRCVICTGEFEKRRMGQKTCSPVCERERKRQTKLNKARREALKTVRDYMKEAQVAFNAYIRERDKFQPCICCGKPLTLDAIGGGYDCGHYRSTGSASHLRFNEDNAHAQRKVCNRYGAGRAVDYRLGLIARIGLERVEALESDCAPHKWTKDELMAIFATYKAKLRALIAERERKAA